MFAADLAEAAALAHHAEGMRRIAEVNARRKKRPEPARRRERDAQGRFLPSSPYYVRRGY